MSKHTPGPWSVEVRLNETWDIDSDSGILIAETYSPNDARLIAAAPDLLEALEGVVRVADRATQEFDAARAAIEKAKGEQQC